MPLLNKKKINDIKHKCDTIIHYDEGVYYPLFREGCSLKDRHRAFLIDRDNRRITRVFVWGLDELDFVSGNLYSCDYFKDDKDGSFTNEDFINIDYETLNECDYIGYYYVKHDGDFHRNYPVDVYGSDDQNTHVAGFYEYDEYMNIVRQTFLVNELCKMIQPKHCLVHDETCDFSGGLITIRDIAFQGCSFVIITKDDKIICKNWI